MSRIIVLFFVVLSLVSVNFAQVKEAKDTKAAKKVTAPAKQEAKKAVKKEAKKEVKKAEAKAAPAKKADAKAPAKKAEAKTPAGKESAVDKAMKEAKKIGEKSAKSIKPTKSPETE